MNDWNIFWSAIGASSAVGTLMAAGVAYYVRLTVVHQLNVFENRFLKELNGRFLSKQLADSLMMRAEERYQELHRTVQQLDKGLQEIKLRAARRHPEEEK